ncbi:S-layer homology domain-containing protein [Deinococcus knuensis]|uniref:S-layer protein SlpA n=1 Tax=Deinococcus knuensis TaxID=1837380 RepID=A0ABQ2SPV2_9DEIO|nr:S-layer homology domain-containing protein [Deinococcus knuensis]GGS36307.1 S-layer protein SlpA [Deinococcus knuensis]
MKKSLLVLTAALSFGVAAAQTAAPASAPQVPALTDVPAGHWAKDAIDKLVSTGIILGYPDGTFRGTQNLTRYEAAVIIARLLDQVKTGDVVVGEIDPETLTALQNAIQELAADLAALGVRVSDLEENAVSRDDFARLEERVEAIALQNGDPEALAGLTSQIDELTARADDYDTLRADVDDNASSIAALNDLTVLLNQDILNLQDRVSAVEAAQADLVARADYDNLAGRVGVVETKVTSLDNRVAQLEKYAFNITPTLSATYFVGRATRDMDVDRLLPGTIFSTGDDGDADTSDTAVDYTDFSGDAIEIVDATADNYYGFSSAGNLPNKAVTAEGSTSISFGITFGTSGKLDTVTSQANGSYVKSAGNLNVNKVDVTFGVRAGLPSGAMMPIVDADGNPTGDYLGGSTTYDGNTYKPLYFYFKSATANFTVGNAPVTVTFGKNLKFKFADYIGDNDAVGRGDGFNVEIDGSTLPLIGAFKPMINTVYGSKGGADGDNQYYRGVRATITPIGTLKAGVHVLQEAADAFGVNEATQDVTAYGADLHGQVAGWQLDSEYATSTIDPLNGDTATENAFYAKTSGSLGPVKVYTLNYRSVSAGYDAEAGIMEANPKATNSTAPYGAGRTGFGVKAKASLGPVSVGGYVDNSVAYGNSPLNTNNDETAIVDRGVAGKVSLFNFVTVRGGYYEMLTGNASPLAADFGGQDSARYAVRGDVTPGLGFSVGGFYRNVSNGAGVRQNSDGGLFAKSTSAGTNEFGLNTTELDSNTCGSTCYSEYGAEIKHDGKAADALVKNLDLTFGYAARYRGTTLGYSNNVLYATAKYNTKLGIANINVDGGVTNSTYAAADTAQNTTTLNGTLDVKTDTLNTVFKPSLEGYVKAYSKTFGTANASGATQWTANDVTYRVGVKLNEFLLPNTKLAVYYAGYQGKNRIYVPYAAATAAEGEDTAGYYDNQNHGRTVSQNLVYVEGNYYDLSFGYGYGTLSLDGAPKPQNGSVFKINYKVNF